MANWVALSDFTVERLRQWFERWAKSRRIPIPNGSCPQRNVRKLNVMVAVSDLAGHQRLRASSGLEIQGHFVVLALPNLNAVDRLGVDEFATLDSSDDELSLRLDRLIRKISNGLRANTKLPINDCLTIERDLRTVQSENSRVSLRRAELKLLEYLAQHRERVVSAQELMSGVLGTSGDGGSIRTQLWELRRKLRAIGHDDAIVTVRGLGYRLVKSTHVV